MKRPLICATLILLVACDRKSISGPPALVESTLDIELRQSIGNWGVMPIGPMPVQNTALVSLGQSLFFDKILSGNRDVSCGTCHDALGNAVDGLSLSIGTGGAGMGPTRSLGSGRRFVPRNAPSLLNTGLGFVYTLWDGRRHSRRRLASCCRRG
jgi:cytochrome c peroxidase